MKVELQVPQEYQTTIASSLNRRKGMVLHAEKIQEFVAMQAEVTLALIVYSLTQLFICLHACVWFNYLTILLQVSLVSMMGYATDLRSMTEVRIS